MCRSRNYSVVSSGNICLLLQFHRHVCLLSGEKNSNICLKGDQFVSQRDSPKVNFQSQPRFNGLSGLVDLWLLLKRNKIPRNFSE